MDPIVTGFGIIGQGGPLAISGGTHTQSIIQGGENIVHGDVITHMLTNPDQVRSSDWFFQSLSVFDWLFSCCRLFKENFPESIESVTAFKPVASLIFQGDL